MHSSSNPGRTACFRTGLATRHANRHETERFSPISRLWNKSNLNRGARQGQGLGPRRRACGRQVLHRCGEFREEIVGHFLGRAVDQPLAELGELAADLRLDIIGQQRAAILVGQSDTRAALGEAGDAAVALAGNLVAVGRIEIGELDLAFERSPSPGRSCRWPRPGTRCRAIISRLSQPGMQAFSTSGSLSLAQTISRGAASWYSPLIVIAIGIPPLRVATHDLSPWPASGKGVSRVPTCRGAHARDWRWPPGRGLMAAAMTEHADRPSPLCAAVLQRGDARRHERPGAAAAHARFRGRAGPRRGRGRRHSGDGAAVDRGGLQRRALRHRGARGSAAPVRQHRHRRWSKR